MQLDDLDLGSIGVWVGNGGPSPELARQLEDLGYGTIWIGGSPGGDLAQPRRLLDATSRIAVATGIVNIWADEPGPTAVAYQRLVADHPGRFLLGVGAGHREATSEYRKPYEALVGYLDGLDAGGVPRTGRVLAALGPKVLRLAAERTAGAHPYLVTPEHTREARDLLGPGVLLAPEQHVVVDADPDRARATARASIAYYLKLRNYTANWLRLGFTEADLADGGSDRLVDALVAQGDAARVAERVQAHLDAGADHVCVQVVVPDGGDPLPAYQQLAHALL